ncbi:Aldo/keto reductase [Fomitiporia mediterranea MF3/22]|uniref:Aldo/keto reductase n=1 Tax=Fomitiporia mediterranea (strain MF3/22) TaxID=694068 RepID=UPI00044082AA|nr:Aldo/keto reductase [Fomitiporia mediterranea MF3/22]EJC99605.1 Aldo/keto reductase [Fomitiporia mediterranea MF3/22]
MSTQVKYRQVGKSGLRVSMPVLGCMGFGSPEWMNWVLSEEQALPILKAAWDLGINTFDTANFYSNGESERVIAKFLEKYNIPREKVVIMDKIYNLVSEHDITVPAPFVPDLWNQRDFVNQGGLSRTALFNQVDKNLSRLNTTYIDLLQVHGFDPNTPLEETMKALHDIVSSGKARYIGACNLRAWQLAEMNNIALRNGWTPFISMQVEHSLLYRPHEEELFVYCNLRDIGIFPFSVLMDGHLARPEEADTARSKFAKGTPFDKKRRDSDKEIIKRVQLLAGKRGWQMSQVAIAWSSAKTSSPIIGANSIARLNDSITTDKTLTDEEIKYLEEP